MAIIHNWTEIKMSKTRYWINFRNSSLSKITSVQVIFVVDTVVSYFNEISERIENFQENIWPLPESPIDGINHLDNLLGNNKWLNRNKNNWNLEWDVLFWAAERGHLEIFDKKQFCHWLSLKDSTWLLLQNSFWRNSEPILIASSYFQ